MIKTKTLITGLALTGALLVSASVAKANANLEVISDGQTLTGTQILPGTLQATGSFTDGWTTSITTGTLSDGPLDIDIGSQDSGSSKFSIEILYFTTLTSAQSGMWNLTLTGNSLKPGALSYTDTIYINGTSINSLGTQLGSVGLGGSTGGSVSGVTSVGEEILITVNGGKQSQDSSIDSGFNITTTVPDGGTTLVLLGAVLIGFTGWRLNLGVKRS